MGSYFDRWEKDPFFSAAEEVQESVDRMESTYRTWIHALKDTSGRWNSDEICRDLRTTLGTAKWQLEEFDRAVSSSYNNSSTDDAKERHGEFVIAIDNQIKKVEKSLNESSFSQGNQWVRLDERELDELAVFLSGPSASSSFSDKSSVKVDEIEQQAALWEEDCKQQMPEYSKSSSNLVDGSQVETKDEKYPGHRKTASACGDIGAWKITVADDIYGKQPAPSPRKIPSIQGLLNFMESSMKLKLSKNGYRKLRFNPDDHQEANCTLPQSQPLTKGINTCCERSKNCLDCCDESYQKQLNGWYGAVQRQLQRSQNYMKYNRPVRMGSSVALLLFLIDSATFSKLLIYPVRHIIEKSGSVYAFWLGFIGVPYLSDEPINCALYRQVISLESYEAGTDCTRIVAVIP